MPNVIRSTILGVGLLTGVAFAAHAQTNNVAALPPGAPAATPPAAAVAVSPKYVGPAPGGLWSTKEAQTQPVQPSPKYVGPAPGGLWSAQESHTQPVTPSGQYPGPRPN